jgi:sialate O-acetylesterase
VPAGVLKEGANVILIRVEDTGGGGGMNGPQENMKLTTGVNEHALNSEWSYKIQSLQAAESAAIGPNDYPTLLFNAMINPLIPYAVKGAIWYQGESNAGRAYQYRKAFPLMITDWRKHWGYDFPFLFVQLASFVAGDPNGSQGSTWAELREAQTMTLDLPNTGMAVTTDIGEAHDIHPRNKQDVGKRLAAAALYQVYGQEIVHSGPTFATMKKEGNKIILSFNNKGGGLMAKDKYGYLKGFEIAGSDQQFKYAKAHIENNQVVVYQDGITDPAAVRYAWADNPEDANLYNKEGFPAVPFRTDTWKGITENAKFSFSR